MIGASLLTLVGCSGGDGLMDDIMASWQGAETSEVITQWGYPDEQREVAGRKLYVWNRDVQMSMPATGTTTGTANVIGNSVFYSGTTNIYGGGVTNWSCQRILEVNEAERVVGGQWRGNNCPFAEMGPYANWRRK